MKNAKYDKLSILITDYTTYYLVCLEKLLFNIYKRK